jgi:hypothetical protein
MEERPELHIVNPASLAESLSSVSSVSTQSTRVTQTPLPQFTPRHVTISEEFLPTSRQPVWPSQGNSLRGIPPHAEFVTRRNSAGTRRTSGLPMLPAEEFTQVSTIPEEPEDFSPTALSNVQPYYVAHPHSTRTISINETPMRPPSVHTPKLPEDLGLSRRGLPVTQIMSQVPLKKTVPDQHIDRNTLPKHVQDRMIASRHFSEILQSQPPCPQLAELVNPGGGDGGDGGGPGGYDGDSNKSYGHDPGFNQSRRPPGGPPGPPDGNDPNDFSFNTNFNQNPKPFKPQPVHFDTKLKPDVIPEWDGNTDELMRWIRKINDISNYSDYMRIQLGQQVPLKFTKHASRWYGSLSVSYQREITENWDTLKLAILIHFMS